MGFDPRKSRGGWNPDFRAAEKDLAHDQFAPQERQAIAFDPQVLSFQYRIVNRRILNGNILQMKTGPRGEADTKNGNRITEIFADDFPQSQLCARGLDIEIDCQQSQPDQNSYCDDTDQRCLNDTFHKPWENAKGTVREYSPDRQEEALYCFKGHNAV
jgi:hypothetical protein